MGRSGSATMGIDVQISEKYPGPEEANRAPMSCAALNAQLLAVLDGSIAELETKLKKP